MRVLALIQAGVWDRFVTRLDEMGAGSGEFALQILLALVVLGVGALVAALAGLLVKAVARAMHFDDVARRLLGAGHGELRHDPTLVAAWVARWIVMLGAIVLAADVLGAEMSHSVGVRLAELLPRVVAALIVLAAGVGLAMLLGGITRGLFANAGFRGSRLRGQIVTIVAIALAAMLALEQLGVAAQFIFGITLALVSGLALAVGLAFGLGARDLARDVLIEYLRSLDDEARRPPPLRSDARDPARRE